MSYCRFGWDGSDVYVYESRAQFGRFADAYDLSAARTKAGKVRLIGNSVCPEVAEALVRANLPREAEAVA